MNEDAERIMESLRMDLPLASEPPKIIRKIPEKYIPEKSDYVSCFSIERTHGGRLWMAYGSVEDGPKGVILLVFSDDEGITWSKPQFLMRRKAPAPSGISISTRSACLWCDPKGRLWWFNMQSLGYFDGRGGVWAAVCDAPDADDIVWTKPIPVWHGAPLNKPTVLRNGGWALPVSLSIRKNGQFSGHTISDDIYPELDPMRGANLVVSHDHGKTWVRHGMQRSIDPCFDENMVLEKKGGSLCMYARDCFGIVSCESNDGGFNWTPFKREWITTCARFFVRALPSGNWLMVRYNTSEPKNREKLTAWLSYDEGATWTGELLLDGDSRISYPDGFIHPDGRIFIIYDYKRVNGELRMAIFREEDVAAGRDVSGNVTLRRSLLRTRNFKND